jgi:isopenicillin N synthase-like dioxygenase
MQRAAAAPPAIIARMQRPDASEDDRMTETLSSRPPAPGEIPVIDIAALRAGDAAGKRRVADEIGRACRGIGFFYVRGHGIDDAAMAKVFGEAKRFFSLPESEKNLISISHSMHNRGYVPLEGENLDPSRDPDLKECFNIGRDLAADDPDVVAGRPFHGPNQWPELAGWREGMYGHYLRLKALCETLHVAFAIDLGLPEDFFAPLVDRPLATLRLLHYPPHPGEPDPKQLGCAPHTDYGNVTVLAQDGIEGLQVLTRDGGEWLNAPVIPGAFVCNIGDLLMRWTNDVYVSTPHRVINRSGKERYSMAFFHDPNDDAVIEGLPGCVSADRPARYPVTTGGRYLADRLNATYAFRRNAEQKTA